MVAHAETAGKPCIVNRHHEPAVKSAHASSGAGFERLNVGHHLRVFPVQLLEKLLDLSFLVLQILKGVRLVLALVFEVILGSLFVLEVLFDLNDKSIDLSFAIDDVLAQLFHFLEKLPVSLRDTLEDELLRS